MYKPYLFLLALIGFATQTIGANEIQGDWSGILDTGTQQLTLVFHIKKNENGNFQGSFDCLEQNVKDIPIDQIYLENNILKCEIVSLAASFEGIFKDSEIVGKFIQGGFSMPLILKSGITSEAAVNRPQEPKPPYPYYEEEVSFENKSAGISLSGTLTLPSLDRAYPTVFLISGSGPLDRNETIMGHKPFLVLADHLTRQGLAVLRIDKRGVGKSTGDYNSATSEDFSSDVLAGIEYLKTRPEIQNIGLIGHSEGGMIAPMVAAISKDVDFIVMMAGPGARCDDLLIEQTTLIQRADGASEDLIQKESELRKQLFAIVKQYLEPEIAEEKMRNIFSIYLDNLPDSLKNEMVNAGIESKILMETTIKKLNTRWFSYFLNYDPSIALIQIKIPVLVLNGSLDLQVPPKQNLPLIEKALNTAGNKDYTIHELPQHNHMFQVCQTGSIKEYAKIEETLSPLTLETISNWILEKVNAQ